MTGFTGSPLDRADHLRERPEAIAALADAVGARLLRLDGLDPVLDGGGRLLWDEVGSASPLALLGIDRDVPHFVALTGARSGDRGPELFAMLDRMGAPDAAIYAAARSLVDWHARHGFCANCGATTEPLRAGWARCCPSCDAQHFPRTDPVVIMLAEHGGRVLVGRQPRFPPGRYSALAGFLEVGESIEEAVARELREEAGVRATAVRYLASQPWPFPSSLMIACIAPVADPHLTLDAAELEDAFWVDGAEVLAALDARPGARFTAPAPCAIAHTLLRRWAADQA